MTTKDRIEQMKKIRDEVFVDKKLPLYAERVKNKVFPVIGEGDHHARIMFIGEAPGRNEAASGRPFCGSAGKILDELLASVGIERKSVYITNIVKDRPPFNRDPLPEEIATYGPYLDRQIQIIRPEIIATLGRFSMQYIMEKFGLAPLLQPISALHGKMFEAKTQYGALKIIPFYHPAATIYNPALKDSLATDFKMLKEK